MANKCKSCGKRIGFLAIDFVLEKGDKEYHFCSEKCRDEWNDRRIARDKPRLATLRKQGNKILTDCFGCSETFYVNPKDLGSVVNCPHCYLAHIIPKADGSVPNEAEIGLKTLEEVGRAMMELDNKDD
jgi:YHS domain-containing protein